MNREMILRVADAIEEAAKPDAHPEFGFNMGSFIWDGDEDKTGHRCGTVACIAGWAIVVGDGPEAARRIDYNEVSERAGQLFELPDADAERLFFAHSEDDFIDLDKVAPSQAVTVLRHLAATGEVDWSKATTTTEARRS